MAYLTQYSSSVPVIKFHIDQPLMTIGQNFEMDICVPEDGVAENHATVEAIKSAESYRFVIKSDDKKSLVDLNGNAVAQGELQDGDWLTIGGVEFQFTDDGVDNIDKQTISTPATTETQKPKPKKETKPQDKQEINKSEALQLIQELKEEVESMSTKDFIEASRFSRRLNVL